MNDVLLRLEAAALLLRDVEVLLRHRPGFTHADVLPLRVAANQVQGEAVSVNSAVSWLHRQFVPVPEALPAPAPSGPVDPGVIADIDATP